MTSAARITIITFFLVACWSPASEASPLQWLKKTCSCGAPEMHIHMDDDGRCPPCGRPDIDTNNARPASFSQSTSSLSRVPQITVHQYSYKGVAITPRASAAAAPNYHHHVSFTSGTRSYGVHHFSTTHY